MSKSRENALKKLAKTKVVRDVDAGFSKKESPAEKRAKKLAVHYNQMHYEKRERQVGMQLRAINREVLYALKRIGPLDGPMDIACRLYIRERICKNMWDCCGGEDEKSGSEGSR